MKKRVSILLVLILAITASFASAETITVTSNITLAVNGTGTVNRTAGSQLISLTSADPSIAKVDGADRIVGVSPGQTKVEMVETGVSADGRDATFQTIHYVTVSAPVGQASFNVSSVKLAVGEDVTLQFTYTGAHSDQPVFSADNGAVAQSAGGGRFVAVGQGSATLYGKLANGATATATMTVVAPPGGLSFISNNQQLVIGDSFDLKPDLKGGQSTNGLAWTNTNPSVASVSKEGVVKAIGVGNTVITGRTHNNYTQSCTINVVGSLPSFSIAHNVAQYVVGRDYAYTALDSNGRQVNVTLTSSDPSTVQVIGPATIRTLRQGNVTMTAMFGGVQQYQQISVVGSQVQPTQVELTPANATLNQGDALQFVPKIPAGSTTTYTYALNNANGSTISPTGLFTAGYPGTTVTVRVTTSNNHSAYATVVVKAAGTPKMQFETNPILVNQTTRVLVKDGFGQLVYPKNYSSSNTSIATVDQSGNIRAYAGGSVTITCVLNDNTILQEVLTVQSSPNQIQATPRQNPLRVGDSTIVDVIGDVGGTFAFTVTSSNNNIVQPDPADQKVLRAKALGEAMITVNAYNGRTASFKMTVTQGGTTGFVLNTSNRDMGIGETFQLSATSQGYMVPCTFTSNAPQYVLVSSTGLIQAVGCQQVTGSYFIEGRATITARAQDGREVSIQVTTYPAPATVQLGFGSNSAQQRTYIVEGGVNMPVGATINLQATVNGGSRPTSLTYITSDSSIASVTQNGVLTGLRPGTTTVIARVYNGQQASMRVTITGSGGGGGGTGKAYINTVSGSLNLREQPVYGARVLITIPRLEIVTVLDKGPTWCWVQYGSYVGYVMTQYLHFYDNPTPTPTYNPWPTPTPTKGSGQSARVTTASGSLNMREQPIMGARVLTTIPQYAYITVYNRDTVWCYVTYDGWTGYVMTQFLTFGSSPTNPPYPTPTPVPTSGQLRAQVTTVSGSLNLRESPDGNARVLTRVPQYMVIDVYTKGGDWCYVTYAGYRGYVMTRYLTFVK